MADIAEDKSAGLVQKQYPRQGEKWRHIKTNHVVMVFGLHIIWAVYKDGDSVWLPRPRQGQMHTAKSNIPANSQCVIFIGNEQGFVREIGNFLERFERVEDYE